MSDGYDGGIYACRECKDSAWKRALPELERLRAEVARLSPNIKRGMHPECVSCDQIQDYFDRVVGDHKSDAMIGAVMRLYARMTAAERERDKAVFERDEERDRYLRNIERGAKELTAAFARVAAAEAEVDRLKARKA